MGGCEFVGVSVCRFYKFVSLCVTECVLSVFIGAYVFSRIISTQLKNIIFLKFK